MREAPTLSLLKDIFNALIDSFIEQKVGIADHFLSESLMSGLSKNLERHFSDQLFLAAGTGNKALAVLDKTVRGDRICWLDRTHGDPFELAFFDLIDEFVRHLNETCYAGITGYEFHYARYEAGSFYRKHLDQFRSDQGRQFSMITYLNAGWQERDGGELCIHHADGLQNIPPVWGRTVLFRSSELEHEVLLTNRLRLSITGWLKS